MSTRNKSILGTWDLEKIAYWVADQDGNPIEGTFSEYEYQVPCPANDVISMVFKADNRGEILDRTIDTFWYDNDSVFSSSQHFVVRPDSVLVVRFTYSYDSKESILYLTRDACEEYAIHINALTDECFV